MIATFKKRVSIGKKKIQTNNDKKCTIYIVYICTVLMYVCMYIYKIYIYIYSIHVVYLHMYTGIDVYVACAYVYTHIDIH